MSKSLRWHYQPEGDMTGLQGLLRKWQEARAIPGLLVLASEQEIHSVSLIQSMANHMNIALFGAIVPGLIANNGILRRGILLLELGSGMSGQIISLPADRHGTGDMAVEQLAEFVQNQTNGEGRDTLLLLVDAMVGDMGSVLCRLYRIVGNGVRYAGGNVGSEAFRSMPCLFDNSVFIEKALLAILLPDNPGARLAHGYSSAASLGVATSTQKNSVATIDGLPAFDRYQELAESLLGIHLSRNNFYKYAAHFPLAQQMAGGEPLLRIPIGIDDDGRVHSLGEIPENSVLGLVTAPDPNSLDTVKNIAAQIQPLNVSQLCVFYCAGRLMHHGEPAALAELAYLGEDVAHGALFGVLSLGEIANYEGAGYPRFHNGAISVLPWP